MNARGGSCAAKQNSLHFTAICLCFTVKHRIKTTIHLTLIAYYALKYKANIAEEWY